MRYPVVNTQALGRATLFPQPSPMMGRPWVQAQPVRRELGQAEQASLAAATAALADAQGMYDRMQSTYPSLVAATNEDDAQKAWEQARQSLENAQKAYQEALAYSQGAGR